MDSETRTISNFLDQELFNNIKSTIVNNEDFAWYKRSHMVDDKDSGYFTHSFYNDNKINSHHFETLIVPILNKLEARALIQIRANLTISSLYDNEVTSFHCDYDNIKTKSKTAILYLNTCDSGTDFKIDNKIKSIKAEENKIVIFNNDIQHRGRTSKDTKFRYILNFNYFN